MNWAKVRAYGALALIVGCEVLKITRPGLAPATDSVKELLLPMAQAGGLAVLALAPSVAESGVSGLKQSPGSPQ